MYGCSELFQVMICEFELQTSPFRILNRIRGSVSSQSCRYMFIPMPNCRKLERQALCRAFSRACANTGNRIAARIAMIAITTRSSIRVKPARADLRDRMDMRSFLGDRLPGGCSSRRWGFLRSWRRWEYLEHRLRPSPDPLLAVKR